MESLGLRRGREGSHSRYRKREVRWRVETGAGEKKEN